MASCLLFILFIMKNKVGSIDFTYTLRCTLFIYYIFWLICGIIIYKGTIDISISSQFTQQVGTQRKKQKFYKNRRNLYLLFTF